MGGFRQYLRQVVFSYLVALLPFCSLIAIHSPLKAPRVEQLIQQSKSSAVRMGSTEIAWISATMSEDLTRY